jgi:DTW domain-containing protein YfiP
LIVYQRKIERETILDVKEICFISIESRFLKNTNTGENIAVIMEIMKVLNGRNVRRKVSFHRIVVSPNLKRSILGDLSNYIRLVNIFSRSSPTL